MSSFNDAIRGSRAAPYEPPPQSEMSRLILAGLGRTPDDVPTEQPPEPIANAGHGSADGGERGEQPRQDLRAFQGERAHAIRRVDDAMRWKSPF